MLLVLIVGGGPGRFIHRVRVQRARPWRRSKLAGGRVQYDWDSCLGLPLSLSAGRMPPWMQALIDWLGLDTFYGITAVDWLNEAFLDDSLMRPRCRT